MQTLLVEIATTAEGQVMPSLALAVTLSLGASRANFDNGPYMYKGPYLFDFGVGDGDTAVGPIHEVLCPV